MFKKIYNLIKILRKLAVSGAVDTLNNIRPIPVSLKFIFFIFSIGEKKQIEKQKKNLGKHCAKHWKIWEQLLLS